MISSVCWVILKAQYLKWIGCKYSFVFMKFSAFRDVKKVMKWDLNVPIRLRNEKAGEKKLNFSLSRDVAYNSGKSADWLPSPNSWLCTTSPPFPHQQLNFSILLQFPRKHPISKAWTQHLYCCHWVRSSSDLLQDVRQQKNKNVYVNISGMEKRRAVIIYIYTSKKALEE